MIYFAYGSNMLTYRLEKRVGKVEIIGVGILQQYELRFNKKSKDDSLKADAFFTGSDKDTVVGILFKIDPNKKPELDKAEGLGNGYSIKDVQVLNSSNNESVKAFTYFATDIDNTEINLPYDWYLEIIIAGANEHNIPEEYISKIKGVKTKQDTNENRKILNLSIIKESQARKKSISNGMELISELNKAKACKIILNDHPFHNRKIVIEKEGYGFNFQTDSVIPRGRQTHKEISVLDKELCFEEENRKWFVNGKNFLFNNISYDWDNTIKIIGGSINAISSSVSSEFENKHLRLIIPIGKKLNIFKDYRSTSFVIDYKLIGGLIPLSISNKNFDFFEVKWGERDYLIIDCLEKLSLNEFQKACNAILLTYAFLSGDYHTGEGYYLSYPDEKHVIPENILFHSLSEPIYDLQNAFTTNAYLGIDTDTLEKDENGAISEKARKELYKNLDFFPIEVFNKICQFALDDDKILRTLILLVNNQSSTLEMKIPIQFVAIETITAAVIKGGNTELKPIDSNDDANTLINKLTNEAEQFFKEKEIKIEGNEKIKPLLKRLLNLNAPTNTDKLSKPFTELGYNLSEEEKSAVKLRDKFLHGSTLSFGEVEDEFKELFFVSLKLNFLIAVLLLKKAGYSGKIINYAKLYDYITEKFIEEDVLKKI